MFYEFSILNTSFITFTLTSSCNLFFQSLNNFSILQLKSLTQWNSMFLAFSLIEEGATEKVLQFTIPLKSFTTKTLASLNKKSIFEHYREVQTIKSLLIGIIVVMKIFFWWPFQSCPLCAYVSMKQRCAVQLLQIFSFYIPFQSRPL